MLSLASLLLLLGVPLTPLDPLKSRGFACFEQVGAALGTSAELLGLKLQAGVIAGGSSFLHDGFA